MADGTAGLHSNHLDTAPSFWVNDLSPYVADGSVFAIAYP